MILARYVGDCYGEVFYGEGDTIELAYNSLKDIIGGPVAGEEVQFFEMVQIPVKPVVSFEKL